MAEKPQFVEQPLDVEGDDVARRAVVVNGQQDGDEAAHDVGIAVDVEAQVTAGRIEPGTSQTWLWQPRTSASGVRSAAGICATSWPNSMMKR